MHATSEGWFCFFLILNFIGSWVFSLWRWIKFWISKLFLDMRCLKSVWHNQSTLFICRKYRKSLDEEKKIGLLRNSCCFQHFCPFLLLNLLWNACYLKSVVDWGEISMLVLEIVFISHCFLIIWSTSSIVHPTCLGNEYAVHVWFSGRTVILFEVKKKNCKI